MKSPDFQKRPLSAPPYRLLIARFVWPVSKARRKAGQSKRRVIPIRFTRAACDWIWRGKFRELPRVCPYWGRADASCKDLKPSKTGLNLMSRKTCIDILIFRFPHKVRVFPCSAQAGVSCRDLPSGKTGSNLRCRNACSSSSWLSFDRSAGPVR